MTRLPVLLPGGSIDRPSPGATLASRAVRISGWAATSSGPCARIELTLDGRPLGPARLGHHRPDVALATGVSEAALSGFELLVDLPEAGIEERRQVELSGHGIGVDGVVVRLPQVRIGVEPQGRDAAFERGSREPTPRHRRHADHSRLLICSHDLNYTGAPLALAELARRLRAQGEIEMAVLSFADGPVRAQFERLGVPVHVWPDHAAPEDGHYESRISGLASWVASQRADVALVNTVAAFPAADACLRTGLPMAWIIHESYTPPLLGEVLALDSATSARLGEALRQASTLVFVADATRALYQTYLPSTPCRTLRCGIDIDEFDRWRSGATARVRQRRDPPGESPVILCVGTITPRKGQVPLIQAFAEIAHGSPGATLQLVGSSGDASSEIARTAAEAFGVADRVRIEPVVSDVRPWYARADLLVSASDMESLPRSMLEAMALGLPILATSVFGVPELITDGHTGWLCEARDVDALARGLDRVLSLDAGDRADVARNARAKVESEYRSDVVSRDWAELVTVLAQG